MVGGAEQTPQSLSLCSTDQGLLYLLACSVFVYAIILPDLGPAPKITLGGLWRGISSPAPSIFCIFTEPPCNRLPSTPSRRFAWLPRPVRLIQTNLVELRLPLGFLPSPHLVVCVLCSGFGVWPVCLRRAMPAVRPIHRHVFALPALSNRS